MIPPNPWLPGRTEMVPLMTYLSHQRGAMLRVIGRQQFSLVKPLLGPVMAEDPNFLEAYHSMVLLRLELKPSEYRRLTASLSPDGMPVRDPKYVVGWELPGGGYWLSVVERRETALRLPDQQKTARAQVQQLRARLEAALSAEDYRAAGAITRELELNHKINLREKPDETGKSDI